MAENSHISWTTHTFNPIIGCCKVSDGCKNCYAETLAKGRMQLSVWGPTAARRPCAESAWKNPIRWNKAAIAAGERHRVFCASMSDVFEGPETCQDAAAYAVVAAARERLWTTIEQTPGLDWLLLTKRAENIFKFLPDRWGPWHPPDYNEQFPRNVWLGISAEDQETFDARWSGLESAVRSYGCNVAFVSLEPLLGPINISYAFDDECDGHRVRTLDWVIVGGESGPNARLFSPDWARSLRDQCAAAEVPFFMKQFGSCPQWTEADHIAMPDYQVAHRSKWDEPHNWPEEFRVMQFPERVALVSLYEEVG